MQVSGDCISCQQVQELLALQGMVGKKPWLSNFQERQTCRLEPAKVFQQISSSQAPELLANAGLPEIWSQKGGEGAFEGGAFSLEGRFPRVEDNIHLIKGLFSDSIPPFLQLQVRPRACVSDHCMMPMAVWS